MAMNEGINTFFDDEGKLIEPVVRRGAMAGGPQQGGLFLQNAGLIWVPLIAVAAFAAWFRMDDLASMKASFADQAHLTRTMAAVISSLTAPCWATPAPRPATP